MQNRATHAPREPTRTAYRRWAAAWSTGVQRRGGGGGGGGEEEEEPCGESPHAPVHCTPGGGGPRPAGTSADLHGAPGAAGGGGRGGGEVRNGGGGAAARRGVGYPRRRGGQGAGAAARGGAAPLHPPPPPSPPRRAPPPPPPPPTSTPPGPRVCAASIPRGDGTRGTRVPHGGCRVWDAAPPRRHPPPLCRLPGKRKRTQPDAPPSRGGGREGRGRPLPPAPPTRCGGPPLRQQRGAAAPTRGGRACQHDGCARRRRHRR
ncbi:hypothetical protein I4F81_002961 [Pyropia yezoensis]|uniref:Uncharacterized protein n=1 Tax=Pyropia yezoensis TaxID=2788 RepID=A0ACC3BR49_PYRYE|nr:hypothetical protein I4F81_002961 [Neopyropia yezoensis]